MAEKYLSLSATVILQAIAHGYAYGFDVMDTTGLPSGTVYPALRRLEAAGLVASRWENAALAQREQRPPRKNYDITRLGRMSLADAVERYRLDERPAPRVGKPSPVRR